MVVHRATNRRIASYAPALEPETSPIAPDCSGQNFYALDRGLRDLLALYLPAGLQAHLEPHFQRLGVLAGGRLDALARVADKNGPVLHPRKSACWTCLAERMNRNREVKALLDRATARRIAVSPLARHMLGIRSGRPVA